MGLGWCTVKAGAVFNVSQMSAMQIGKNIRVDTYLSDLRIVDLIRSMFAAKSIYVEE